MDINKQINIELVPTACGNMWSYFGIGGMKNISNLKIKRQNGFGYSYTCKHHGS